MMRFKWKNKIVNKMGKMSVIAIAACIAMSPITAFAQGPDKEEQECICEQKCEDKNINEECPICSADSSLCEGKVAKQPKEETTQSEEEKMGPLTPKGNLSLVDDYGTIEAGGKQFMTVVTKSGKYFYIIIDRDDKGTETVHFLNMVDESDLLALMDEEQVEEYMAKTGTDEKEETTEIAQPVKEASAEETEKEEVKPVEDKPKKNNNSGLIIGLLVLILGGGAGFMYVKNTKSKKNTSTGIDPDMDYDEEDEDYLSTLPKDEEDIDVNDDLEEESEEDSEEE